MKLAWLATAGLFAFAAPALAQDAPPPPAASAAAQAPVDPERLALAREMMAVFDMKSMMQGMFGNMANAFKLPAGATPDQQERVKQLFASLGSGFEATMPEMMDAVAVVYARNFTTQEMRDTLAFYHSPSGQAMLTKMPAMMREVMPASMSLMPKMIAAAKADYCAHRTCDKTDDQMFEVMAKAYGRRPG
jgi:hypothetical protein